jgi:hypothetical protein
MAINLGNIDVNAAKKATATGTCNEASGTHSWVLRKLPAGNVISQGTITVADGRWSVESDALADGMYEFIITTSSPQIGGEFTVGGLPM